MNLPGMFAVQCLSSCKDSVLSCNFKVLIYLQICKLRESLSVYACLLTSFALSPPMAIGGVSVFLPIIHCIFYPLYRIQYCYKMLNIRGAMLIQELVSLEYFIFYLDNLIDNTGENVWDAPIFPPNGSKYLLQTQLKFLPLSHYKV